MRYRNVNTNDVVEYDEPSPRLDALDNWERVRDDDDQDDRDDQPAESLLEIIANLTSEQRDKLRAELSDFDELDQAARAGGDLTQPFDPSVSTVEQVNAYLADADPAERVRVFTVEADGQGRKGILAGPHADTD